MRHGAPPVTAYVEVGPRTVEAFVRDHGAGFDLDDISADRLGVRESILGRMERHGGSAKIRRLEAGTEVELCLPVSASEPLAASGPAAALEPVADLGPVAALEPVAASGPAAATEPVAASESIAEPAEPCAEPARESESTPTAEEAIA